MELPIRGNLARANAVRYREDVNGGRDRRGWRPCLRATTGDYSCGAQADHEHRQ